MAPDGRLRAGSVLKTLVATAVLQTVESVLQREQADRARAPRLHGSGRPTRKKYIHKTIELSTKRKSAYACNRAFH
ncbi:MAG: hypothetical protein IT372_11715 [Polyangiaceae bacterium]|nr:hypothetical protein [Polyangiaceae bacterium]